MSYVRIPPKGSAAPLPADPAIHYNFPLDPFQLHAIDAIEKGHHVFITAKTGSGKTLPAEYQIAYTLKKKQRIFYTGPIKALMNQKFNDLKALFPTATVGILTGDIKFAPDADIVVMTTEILRNLLFKQHTATAALGIAGMISLRDVGAVIFDEVHYINDPDRGHVWEECLILMPKSIQMVLLSATIDSAYELAEWIGRIKERPIALLSTTYRVVPLIHGMFQSGSAADALPLVTLKESDESPFQTDVYRIWLRSKNDTAEAVEKWKRTVETAKRRGEPVTATQNAEKPRIMSFPHRLNECIQILREKDLCPAIFFVFSRNDCKRYALAVEHSLLSGTDAASVRNLFHFHLHKYKSVESLPQYHELYTLAQKGIAFHHSGVLPLLKEIVELLFAKGLIRVLFATETFAVGLNLPARTVVFTDLRKPSAAGLRPLRADEYIQMAGRAGRRGKDTKGIVLHLPAHEPLNSEEMRNVLAGPLIPLHSRMQFGYEFVLKALWSAKEASHEILTNSYWKVQEDVAARALHAELEALEKIIPDATIISALEERETLETTVRTTRRAAQKAAQTALTAWTAAHSGTTWDMRWAGWATLKRDLHRRTGLRRTVAAPPFDPIAPLLKTLQAWEYVTEDCVLTAKGILATEVNEGNPIYMVELYTSRMLEAAPVETIISTLACFITESIEIEPAGTFPVDSKVLDFMDAISQKSIAIEKKCGIASPEDQWALSTSWVVLSHRWLAGESAAILLAETGMFEGNFMKGILKLNHLVQEWISLATYDSNVEMLARFADVETKLLRDIVVPESLYVK
jgi:superfamily II RNA helicase